MHFGSLKVIEKSPVIYLCKSQVILHHLCDHCLLWYKIWRTKSIPLQPLTRITLDVKWKDHVSNTIIYTMTNTEPLVHCLRKSQLGFLGHILWLPDLKNLPGDMLSTYYFMTRGTWMSMYLLPWLHPTCVWVWWKWDGSRRDRRPCQSSMCLEKACNQLLCNRRMIIMMMIIFPCCVRTFADVVSW